jgi:RNA-directed DNA polymerase
MYDHPRRRGGHGVAGARDRLVPADFHVGSYRDFLGRHAREAAEAARGDRATKQAFAAKLLKRTVDFRNLRCAWFHLAAGGGDTPGVNGLRYPDLDDHEVWDLLRALSKAILADTYRVAPDRIIQIPKGSGRGYRTLRLPVIEDRVVGRAVVQTVQPFVDPLFDERSLGFRPGRGRFHALALAEKLAGDADRWVWITEDVRDAFGMVPQNRLLDVVRHHLRDADIVRLVERVVRTKSGRGLPQGGCLSPLLTNIYLDWFLDRKWRQQHPDVPLIRVADDLLLLCSSREEADEAYADLERMLRAAGMPLKGNPESAIWSLKDGEPVTWLGYRLTRQADGLQAHLTESSWERLSERLALTHLKPEAPLRAVEALQGWVSMMGPCLPAADAPATYARITSLARSHAFYEIPSYEAILACWRHAYARWLQVRKDVRGDLHEGHPAAPPARITGRPTAAR